MSEQKSGLPKDARDQAIFEGWLSPDEADDLKRRLAEAEAREAVLFGSLEELHAQVVGECPSLLNEDSGGDARLALDIQQALTNTTPRAKALLAVVEAAEQVRIAHGMGWDMDGVLGALDDALNQYDEARDE